MERAPINDECLPEAWTHHRSESVPSSMLADGTQSVLMYVCSSDQLIVRLRTWQEDGSLGQEKQHWHFEIDPDHILNPVIL